MAKIIIFLFIAFNTGVFSVIAIQETASRKELDKKGKWLLFFFYVISLTGLYCSYQQILLIWK